MNMKGNTKMLLRVPGALVAIILVCGAAGGPRHLERPPFSVDLVPLTPTAAGQALNVGVVVSGSLGQGAVASIPISAPGGLQIAAGDSTFSAPLVGLVPMHHLQLSGQRPGQHVLRARATVLQAEKERAVAEVGLVVTVSGDTIAAGPRSWYRSELVEGDQRYRVSGPWLVPIDAPEEVDAADVLANPVKPAILTQVAARLANCQGSLGSARVLVVVDPSGAVRHARVTGEGHDSAVADSVLAAVRRWRFAPARIGKTPVTDCLIVSVPISR